jgi:hypothetical protein
MLKALPTAQKSKTESDDPILLMPYTLRLEPKREKPRIEVADPTWKESSTDSDDPSLTIP